MDNRLIFLYWLRGTETRSHYVLTEMYVEPSFRAKQNGELSSKKSSSIKPVPQTDTGSQGENPKALE
jgi:hypothetical protein